MLSRRRAGVTAGTKGRLGGFLSRRTRTLPVRAAANRPGGPLERAITIREKRTFRRGGIARRTRTARSIERARRLLLMVSPHRCRFAGWEDEAAQVCCDLARPQTKPILTPQGVMMRRAFERRVFIVARETEYRLAANSPPRRSCSAALCPQTLRGDGRDAWLHA